MNLETGTEKLTSEQVNRLRQQIEQDTEDNLPLDWSSIAFQLRLPYLSVVREGAEIERVKHEGYGKLPPELHGSLALLMTMGLRADMSSIFKRDDKHRLELYTGGWLGLRVPLDILPQIFDYLGATAAISPNLKDHMLKNSEHLRLLHKHCY
jgi:hypothetical protein